MRRPASDAGFRILKDLGPSCGQLAHAHSAVNHVSFLTFAESAEVLGRPWIEDAGGGNGGLNPGPSHLSHKSRNPLHLSMTLLPSAQTKLSERAAATLSEEEAVFRMCGFALLVDFVVLACIGHTGLSPGGPQSGDKARATFRDLC